MTPFVSTARIQAEKALQQTCGQECVDWAIGLLVAGHDEHFLLRLAAMLPPYNHFEIADLRDKALQEMGVQEISTTEAVTIYASDILNSALNRQSKIIDAVAQVSQLCIAHDYQKNIFDFYLLDNAYDELQGQGVQWYWDGATAENITSLMLQSAARFVQSDQ